MELTVRLFKKEDLEEMTAIWNQVVEEANAFPQEDFFSLKEAEDFLQGSLTLGWLNQTERFLAFIYCIQIMWADADIYPMRPMQSARMQEAGISESSWFWTVWKEPESWDTKSCSLMRW